MIWFNRSSVGFVFRLSKILTAVPIEDDVMKCPAPLWCTCIVSSGQYCRRLGFEQSDVGWICSRGLRRISSFMDAVTMLSQSCSPSRIVRISSGVRRLLAARGNAIMLPFPGFPMVVGLDDV